jgi:hypothetical protein
MTFGNRQAAPSKGCLGLCAASSLQVQENPDSTPEKVTVQQYRCQRILEDTLTVPGEVRVFISYPDMLDQVTRVGGEDRGQADVRH